MAPKGFEPLQLAPGVFKTPVSTFPPEGQLVLNFQGSFCFRKSYAESEAVASQPPLYHSVSAEQKQGWVTELQFSR